MTMAAVAAAMTTAVCGSFSCCAAAEDGEITVAEADVETIADAIPADAEIFKGRNILSMDVSLSDASCSLSLDPG